MPYDVAALTAFVTDLFAAAGEPRNRAQMIAGVLVEGDLLGYTTHGLELAPRYLDEMVKGAMAVDGDPIVVSDHKAIAVWDGRRLSGVWLTATALETASTRAAEYGIGAVAIRNSHHIACLSAYLEPITARGQVALIASSDPATGPVAPAGGLDGVFTPDPIAVGIPTEGDPILIDMSASITTMGMAARLRDAGQSFPGLWAQDAQGKATTDPSVIFAEPRGTLLPTGGQDHGHKGYGQAFIVEALSQGLSGGGRVENITGWGASVYVQVFEPALFAGLAQFARETSTIAQLCLAARSINPKNPVRLPGERALSAKRHALANGVILSEPLASRLDTWAERLGTALRLSQRQVR